MKTKFKHKTYFTVSYFDANWCKRREYGIKFTSRRKAEKFIKLEEKKDRTQDLKITERGF